MKEELFALVLAFFIAASPGAAQEWTQLLGNETRDLLHEALSGEIAKDHVIQITRHHRIQGSRGFRNAAQYVLGELQRSGIPDGDAYIESFLSDGKIQYQTWQSPSGWHIERAELRMLEPYEERIVGYPEIAMSVVTYSNPGDVTAELVWVGPGTRDSDYAGKDVAGKIVLCTGNGGAVHRLAVLEYGARVVVCYLDDQRAKDHPDMLAYTGMWPRTDELDRVTFGFNLTQRQGDKLRRLLESGERVVVNARVEGPGLESYFMDVVVAHIRGTDLAEEELVFSAHLDHPKESANDNASGSAALLDIVTTLNELIESGRLARPRRSLRFLWIPEYYGMMAYVDAHPEMVGPDLGGTFLANINMDMVGEDLEKLHSRMILTRTPSSLPSVFNDVIENMAEMVDRMNVRTLWGSQSAFNYRVTPYSGGSDHQMFIDRKIPGMMMGHDPDYTHHTSEDTPDKVDPVELERSELIATGAMLYLANLDAEQATDLAHLASANAARRLGLAGRSAQRRVADAPSAALSTLWAEGQNALDHALEWERTALRSVLHFNADPATTRLLPVLETQLTAQHAALTGSLRETAHTRGASGDRAPALAESPDRRVPVRTTRGPVESGYPGNRLAPERAAWYSTPQALAGNARFEALNFVDGERTVTEIRNALSAEFGPIPTATVARFLDDMVLAGALRWRD